MRAWRVAGEKRKPSPMPAGSVQHSLRCLATGFLCIGQSPRPIDSSPQTNFRRLVRGTNKLNCTTRGSLVAACGAVQLVHGVCYGANYQWALAERGGDCDSMRVLTGRRCHTLVT